MTLSGIGNQYSSSKIGTYIKSIKSEQTKNSSADAVGSSEQDPKESTLEGRIIAIAKKDAANGVYMSSEYAQLERNAVSECSPDRTTAMSQVSSLMASKNRSTEGMYRWIAMLIGLPYKAEMSSGLHGDYASIYDENGEMIASYNWQSGWTSVPTAAENACTDKLTGIYYNAYHEARTAIKSGTTQNAGVALDLQV